MRSYDANDKYDVKEAAKLGAESWMLDLLKLNPLYVHWGPHEDYMWTKKDSGWQSPVTVPTWKKFTWELDDLNECVNFYFQVRRASVKCEACDGAGYNPKTKRISDDFYDFAETGRRWCDKITQDEVDVLVEEGRLSRWDASTKKWAKTPRTAAEVNAAQKHGFVSGDLHSHDAINRGILIEARAKRLGVYGMCSACGGEGSVFTEPNAHASLVLWIIHPRKGASRGVEIECIERDEIPAALAFLRKAAQRNADRFSKIVGL